MTDTNAIIDIGYTSSKTTISGQEEQKKVFTPKVKILEISENVIRRFWDKVSIKPSSVVGTEENNSMPVFGFRVTNDSDKKNILVCIPKNLESFVDNWLVIAAMAVTIATDATCMTTLTDVRTDLFPVKAEAKPFLQGCCSVLREFKETGTVTAGNYTGKFGQGRLWMVDQYLQYHKNAKLFKKPQSNLVQALAGTTVWAKGTLSAETQRIVNLLSLAARRIEIKPPDLVGFMKSSEQIINENFKHTYAYKSGAVFSSQEIDFMKNQILDEQTKFDNFIERVYKDKGFLVEADIPKIYRENAQALLDYDAKVAQIGAARAKYLYNELSARKEVKNAKRGFSREERLAMLSLDKQIICTNPIGLAVKQFSIQIQFDRNDTSEKEILDKLYYFYWKTRDSIHGQNWELFHSWVVSFIGGDSTEEASKPPSYHPGKEEAKY
jgi:hypothetical protein